jgi:hypothetical protein
MGTLEKEIKFTRHPEVRISNNTQVRISVFFSEVLFVANVAIFQKKM